MTTHRLTPLLLGLALAFVPPLAPARAQNPAYTARLSVVPIDLAMAATIAGSGTATATLAGTTLTIIGTFEGLKSPATAVRLHRAQRGVRGPAVLDLQATRDTQGSISGTVELSASQIRDLQEQRLYIQLSSEKAPDGNLWGWLQPRTAGAGSGKTTGKP